MSEATASAAEQHNAQLKAERLHRKMEKQQGWANQVAAQVELRRREYNRELTEIAAEQVEYAVEDMSKRSEAELIAYATRVGE